MKRLHRTIVKNIYLILIITTWLISAVAVYTTMYTELNLIQQLNDIITSEEKINISKIYIISISDPFDEQLLNELTAKNITLIQSPIFNESLTKESNITMISFSWLKIQNRDTLKNIEKFIFSGQMIIFFGPELYNIYEKLNATVIQENFAVFPGFITENNTIKMFVPENLISIAFMVFPKKENQTRYITNQFYLVGPLNVKTIISHLFEWFEIATSERDEFLKVTTKVKKKLHNTDITPSGWDSYIGSLGWYDSSVYWGSTHVGTQWVRTKYWYELSDSRPEQWRYFLVHTYHQLDPTVYWSAPYKTITKVDCDTDNKSGQILDDWGPKNWGGPDGEIEFGVTIAEGGASAYISYSFSANTLSWGDLTSAGLGVHEVEHKFYTLTYIPYGYTATVEPTTIFFEDNTKDCGEEPLEIVHFAEGTFYLGVGPLGALVTTSITFSALVYSNRVYSR